MVFTRIILIYGLLEQGNFINSCPKWHVNDEVFEYLCVAQYNDENKDFGSPSLPQCVVKCLAMSTCRYINYNDATGQCFLGLGACQILEPAPGFVVKAFGPARDACFSWGSSDAPGRLPVQMYAESFKVYVSRSRRSNALIPGIYYTAARVFFASNEGEYVGPINPEKIDILTANSACTLSWIPYTSGAAIPPGVVIGGHLANGTNLYVVYVDDSTHRPAYGYYNPNSKVAHYEIDGTRTARAMHLLIVLWQYVYICTIAMVSVVLSWGGWDWDHDV